MVRTVKGKYEAVWVRCDDCRLEQIKFVNPGEVCTWECKCGGEMYITQRGDIYIT